MRANEFVTEAKVGRLSKTKQFATVGLHKFRDESFADRFYELERVMRAAAATDGTFVPNIDQESWAGRHNIAVPYTAAEANMLKKAYQATGSWHRDLNHNDLRSQEIPSTNKISPVKAFGGYPR
jgi:hypothetical protein